jgi:hypothetical protein
MKIIYLCICFALPIVLPIVGGGEAVAIASLILPVCVILRLIGSRGSRVAAVTLALLYAIVITLAIELMNSTDGRARGLPLESGAVTQLTWLLSCFLVILLGICFLHSKNRSSSHQGRAG